MELHGIHQNSLRLFVAFCEDSQIWWVICISKTLLVCITMVPENLVDLAFVKQQYLDHLAAEASHAADDNNLVEDFYPWTPKLRPPLLETIALHFPEGYHVAVWGQLSLVEEKSF